MDRPAEARRWLVTGAAGFLGANIGAHLEGRAQRIGLARSPAVSCSTFDEWMSLDLTDTPQLRNSVLDCSPDVVVHAAALASHEACEADPPLAEQINVETTRHLARAAADVGAQFILISTDAVFDGERGLYAEDDAPSPTSVYGRTKLKAESVAREVSDPLIVRTNFFGWSPSGTRSILEFFVNALRTGHQVRGFTDFTTTSAYAPYLAATLEELVDRETRGTYHVTSSDPLSKHEFGLAVADAFGLDPGLITPTVADIHPPRGRDISLDVSRVEALLGRSLRSQTEGIRAARHDEPTLRPLMSEEASP